MLPFVDMENCVENVPLIAPRYFYNEDGMFSAVAGQPPTPSSHLCTPACNPRPLDRHLPPRALPPIRRLAPSALPARARSLPPRLRARSRPGVQEGDADLRLVRQVQQAQPPLQRLRPRGPHAVGTSVPPPPSPALRRLATPTFAAPPHTHAHSASSLLPSSPPPSLHVPQGNLNDRYDLEVVIQKALSVVDGMPVSKRRIDLAQNFNFPLRDKAVSQDSLPAARPPPSSPLPPPARLAPHA